MEENKNSDTPDTQPSTASPVPPPAVQPSSSYQQPAILNTGHTPADLPPDLKKQNTFSKILKYFFIAIVMAPVIFVAGWILIFVASGQIKMFNLQNAADKKLEKLEQILVIDGEVKEARAAVDGDALTANSDPARSTFVYLSFDNKSSLGEIETKLADAMEKEGFKRDGGDVNPYYKMSSPAYAGYRLSNANRIIMRYSNNEDAMKITYELDKYYSCPQDYVCERTKNTKSSENIYDIRSFATLPVIKVSINYADKDNYQTQF